MIVAGLAVIGGEAIATIGAHGALGDLSFAVAGLMFATFSTLLRFWRITPMRAVAATSVVSLVDLPIHWLLFGFERMIALGLLENLLQAVVQGIFAGALSTYLFTRAVVLLGAGRAAVFPSLVPGFTLLIGFLALGEVPSLAQLAGFAIVLIGFRLTQTRTRSGRFVGRSSSSRDPTIASTKVAERCWVSQEARQRSPTRTVTPAPHTSRRCPGTST